jgi:serine/threonine protein kinase
MLGKELGTLNSALEKKMGGLDDFDTKLTILEQIARGMCYLHSKNGILTVQFEYWFGESLLIHYELVRCLITVVLGNLTSRSVFLGDSIDAAYIGDFSTAHLAQQNREFDFCSADAPWMAPELLAQEEYNELVDVYSFGMIVWEMTTNKVPYAGVPLHSLAQKVCVACTKERTRRRTKRERERESCLAHIW